MSVLRVESFRKGIIFSSAFNIGAKALGFAANLAVAFYFGSQTSTDVYFYAFGTVTIVSGFLTMLNAAVLIPESMRIAEEEGRADAMRFLNLFLFGSVGLTDVVSSVVFLDPVMAFRAVSRFDPAALAQHVDLLRWSIPLFLLMVLSTYLTDILTSFRYFTIPMIFSMVSSCLVLASIALLHDRLNVASVLVGLIVSSIIQVGVQVWLLVRQLDWKFAVRPIHVRPLVTRNILFAQAGNLATAAASFVPIYLLSGFHTGIVTALSFGQKIADLPTTLVTAQASSVAGIRFNELVPQERWDSINDVFQRTVGLLVFILMPVTVLLSVFSREVVELLFQRGAFTVDHVAVAAGFLSLLVWALPVTAINSMVARLNMAAQRIREAFWYQVGLNLVLIAAVATGVQFLGPFGYPAGFLAASALNLFALGWFLRRVIPAAQYPPVLNMLGRVIGLNLPAALLVVGGRAVLAADPVAEMFAGGALYAAVTLGLNDLLRVNDEARSAVRGVLGRIVSIFD